MKNLGKIIKDLRVKKGLTQEQLAASIQSTSVKSSKSNISNYERGQSKPPYNVLNAIANVLDVPLDELLSYTVAETSNTKDISIENQKDKRPRRVNRLLSAFDKLSDEAQIKAIERVEELVLVPMYQQTLPGVLQEYICNRCRLVYALVKDTDRTETYDGDNRKWKWHTRYMVLQNGIEQNRNHQWNCFYFSEEPIDDSSVAMHILENLNIPKETGYNLAFVFDDKITLSSFYSCYQNQKKFMESGSIERSEEISILFLLVEREGVRIKGITEYYPDKY